MGKEQSSLRAQSDTQVVLTLKNNLIRSMPDWVEERYGIYQVRVMTALFSALPPLALGAAAPKLDTIFNWTGLNAFLLEMFIPCCKG
jgi:hypothetical protein